MTTTTSYNIDRAWTPVATNAGQVVLTPFMAEGRMWVTTGAVPDVDPNASGHVLPTRENITILLNADEILWVHGHGFITVTEGG